ncbi:MAG: hypothetical protein ACJA2W_001203 [Planctomycetota bacterium]|jgi:hypothetical protein
MIPHEKALVKRLVDEPFAIFGINTDPADVYREKRTSFGVNWPSIHDGGVTKGPIVRRWGVTGFPSIYLLDHLGRIRFKGLADKDLDAAIEQLLAEERGDLPSPATNDLLDASLVPAQAGAAARTNPKVGRLKALGGKASDGGL